MLRWIKGDDLTKQETLKKIVELADGFENIITSLDLPCVELCTPDEKISIALKYVEEWEHYPLLIRRAVEGWNDNTNRTPETHYYICYDACSIMRESGIDNTCGCRFSEQFASLPFGYDHKYVYSHFGYNLKATDMQAAVGCDQLEKFPSFVEKRKSY